jgi:hypothetical protein
MTIDVKVVGSARSNKAALQFRRRRKLDQSRFEITFSSAFIGLNIDLRLQMIVSRERCCQIQVATRVQYYF